MNWIDALILLIFCFYVYEDYHRGFLRLVADLIGLTLAFILAISYYSGLATFLDLLTNIPSDMAKPVAFLIIWLAIQLCFYGLSKIVSFFTPIHIKESKLNKYSAILPAALKGAIFIIVIMILIVAIPIEQQKRKMFTQSFIGRITLKYATKGEEKLERIFGDPSVNTLGSITFKEQEPTKKLEFSTAAIQIDPEAEKFILEKINEEREKVGAKPLVSNTLIRNVARAHARDMLIRGYFSHESANGASLFDRYNNANVNFIEAAENIALAATPELVHVGLMNSEKHKRNILDPAYGRVGVGVINAGHYGLMVVEDFAN